MPENRTHDRKYFEQLLQDVEQETKRTAEDREQALLNEDPLGINYARWATEEEMIRSLTAIPREHKEAAAAGVPILCKDDVVYTDARDSHSMIIGASGSKKTRLFILPSILTLMKAGESMIVTDPKAELYERTSGRLRENGYEVLCINFRDDSRQNCWNPLDAPRRFFNKGKFDVAIGLLNDFCTIAVPKDEGRGDPFWDDTSRATFMGLLLIMFLLAEDPAEINIRGLLRMRNSLFSSADVKKSPFYTLLNLMDPGSLVASYLSAVAVAPERTMGSILATLDTHLLKFIMRPDLTDMLCHHEVDFAAIGKEKTAIFLVMPDEKETYHGLISIFVQQCYESLIFEAQNMPGKTLPRRVNFLLDEFSSLPPIKEFPAMIAAARSRNIRFNIVIQSEKQLRSRYREEADTIKGNCNNWFFLYSRELETLEEICRLCGNQKSGAPLITPSRLQRLDKDKGEVLIIHGRQYPFLSHLDDVSVYDGEEFLPPYCKKTTQGELKVFKVDELMKQHSSEWISARLDRNSVRQAQAELEEQKKAEEERLKREKEEAAILEEKLRLARMMAHVDWINVQQAPPEDDFLLQGSRAAYEKMHPETVPSLFGKSCVFLKQLNPEGKENLHRIAPEGDFSLNYISMLSEMNHQHLVLKGEDEEMLSHAAHHVYRRALVAGQSVPLYFDMSKLDPAWNPLIFRHHKDKASLLLMHLCHQVMGVPLPPPLELEPGADLNKLSVSLPEEMEKAMAKMRDAFSAQPEGMPKYLLILHLPEKAPYAFDGLWQTLTASTFENVRLFITTTAEEFLSSSCSDYLRIRGYGTKRLTKEEADDTHLSAWPTLYFDESTNEVKMRQPLLQALVFEGKTCCPC
ncbi:MAG: type IV secretory system conjugative DNA transfer family protein [Clostridia bacterium]|nr:type IV secretory system conjugative DNA transfer family protein [Clostridia bacterium]